MSETARDPVLQEIQSYIAHLDEQAKKWRRRALVCVAVVGFAFAAVVVCSIVLSLLASPRSVERPATPSVAAPAEPGPEPSGGGEPGSDWLVLVWVVPLVVLPVFGWLIVRMLWGLASAYGLRTGQYEDLRTGLLMREELGGSLETHVATIVSLKRSYSAELLSAGDPPWMEKLAGPLRAKG